MINSGDLNFSFSGLKTAVFYIVKKNPNILKTEVKIAEICHHFQQAVIDVLISKTLQAAKKYKPKTIMLAGGVSANKELRNQLEKAIKKNMPLTAYRLPLTVYSVDNAVMIASAAYWRWKKSKNKRRLYENWKKLPTDANLKLRNERN